MGEGTYSNGISPSSERLAPHISKQSRNLVLVDLVELGTAVLAGVEDVLSEQSLGDLAHWRPRVGVVDVHGFVVSRCTVRFGAVRVSGCVGDGVCSTVRIDDKGGEAFVLGWVHCVSNDAEDVETGEDRLGQFHVLAKGDGAVVAAADRIGGGDDSAAGLEGGDDACFRNGDGLLFHGFVDRRSILVIHLVELVDKASAFVCENESASLECPFLC